MADRICYHCKQPVAAGAAHDCWSTTPEALTRDLSEDLQDAWERLRETAEEFGAQRIYASHKSIMFARTACYFFVRPKKRALEICVFLGRAVIHPRIRRTDRASSAKIAHTIDIRHRDEVEAPITDWLREAYETSESLSAAARQARASKPAARKPAAKKPSAKKLSAKKPRTQKPGVKKPRAKKPPRRRPLR